MSNINNINNTSTETSASSTMNKETNNYNNLYLEMHSTSNSSINSAKDIAGYFNSSDNQAWRYQIKNQIHENDVNSNINGKINMIKRNKEESYILTGNSFTCYTPIILQDKRSLGLIDTGADFSVLNRNFILNNKVNFYPKHGLLNLAGKNNTLNRIGVSESINIRYNGKSLSHSFEIMEFSENDKVDVILGTDILNQLGITLSGVAHTWDDTVIFDDSIDDTVKPNNSPSGSTVQQKFFMKELTPYINANQNIPKNKFCTVPESTVHLDTTPGKVANIRQYPIAYKLIPTLRNEINKWLENGVIKKAPVNTAWNSPLTLVDKKDADGNKTGKRPCLDPRHINVLLPDDKYPLPLITDIFHKLSGSTIFTTLDLTAAFHRFQVYEKDQPKTAFTFDGQQYMFVGAPFGIKFLSNVFQRVMSRIFEHMPFVQCFVDDVVIFSRNIEEHLIHVKAAIRALTEVNLILNLSKCHFAQNCVYLLGFCISAKGSSLDTRKLTNIESWPQPSKGVDIQQFLGVVNYFREHVPKAAHLTAPLDFLRNCKHITEKDWTPLHQAHFNAIKKILLSNVVLSQPELSHPLCVATDASNFGIAAVLYQEYKDITPDSNASSRMSNKGARKVIKYIGFMARSLTKSERNYSTTKRELLSVVFALKKFHKFLWGNKFTLYTDHKALTYLHTQKYPNTMMNNWLDTILDYNFDVIHLKGIDNVLPDRLSRLFPTDESLEGGMSRSNLISNHSKPIKEGAIRKLKSAYNRYSNTNDYMSPPENERKAVLLRAHLLGHYGAEHIVKSLHNDGISWKDMISDAVELVKSCKQCQRYNISRKGYHPLRPIYSYLPGDHWSMDLAELPTSDNGFKYILVMLDICTRFCILRCLPDKSANTIVKHLIQVFSDFGYPRILQSDNGSEFKNVTIKLLTESTGIDHRLTTPYHPRANGSAERWVQEAKKIVAKAVEGSGNNWDFYVPSVQLALNNRISKRLNTEPFSLMFARRLNSFADYRNMDPEKSKPLSYEELIERIDHMTNIVFPAIKDQTNKYVEQMKTQFEKYNTIVDDFEEGCEVMVRIPTMTGSLQPSYEGPYKVLRKTKGGSYILSDEVDVLMPRDYAPSELKRVVTDEEVKSGEIYEIEGIIGHKGKGKSTQYLVRWKGYSKAADSWLTADRFTHLSSIENYWKRIGKNPNNKSSSNINSHKDKELSKPKHIDKYYKNKGNLYEVQRNMINLNDLDHDVPSSTDKTRLKKRTNNQPIDNLRRSKRQHTSNTPV